MERQDRSRTAHRNAPCAARTVCAARTARTARTVLAAALLLALAAAVLAATPREARAADADPNTYYAEVQYYDNIQMRYIVQHGIDEYWTTTGDIPIGGFIDGSGNQLLDQAYCVDATVAFHGSTETQTSWPHGVTTDTTAQGYVVASPLAVSANVRANLPSLYWLAVNGFRGERGGANNTADIRVRYAALEGRYGTPIDDTIAIMATKAAVWSFTDPTFALLSTSLVPDTANPTAEQKARYGLMVALMKGLVADARAEGLTLATTTLEVGFDNNGAAFTQPLGPGTDWYYGPVRVDVASSNGTGTPQEVYLTASGMYASELVFVNNASPVAVALPKGTLYGSAQEAPYVSNGGSFYLKIPVAAAGEGALVNIGQPSMDFSYLALHGFGRSVNVTYEGTPAIMAWQGPAASTSTQEWGHVQAFIGFVNNMQASLYGEGHLLLRGNSDNAAITVSKAVLGATSTADAGSFVFTLEVFDNNLQDWVPVPLIPAPLAGANIQGSSGLAAISPEGVFSLADGDTVQVTGLPFGSYRVSEQESVDGYTAVHQLSSGPEEKGFVAEVVLGPQSASRSVVFTNTITPKTPDVPDVPDVPDTPTTPTTPTTPGTPDTPGGNTTVPATGDGDGARAALLAVLLLSGGAGTLLRCARARAFRTRPTP
jgi:hypothetical protein